MICYIYIHTQRSVYSSEGGCEEPGGGGEGYTELQSHQALADVVWREKVHRLLVARVPPQLHTEGSWDLQDNY